MFAIPHRIMPAALAAAALAGVLAAVVPVRALAATHGFTDDGFEYALVDPGPDHGSSFSATSSSLHKLESLVDHETEPFFWFALDGRSWIIRDAATVAEATRILEPVRALGKKQGKLGGKQGALGGRQGQLGGEQGRLGARQAVLGSRIAVLATRGMRGGRETSATRAERQRIADEMEELGRRQEELGRRQQPLGDQQAILGEQQAVLGKQQASASKKAGVALRRLADRARDDGTAKRYEN